MEFDDPVKLQQHIEKVVLIAMSVINMTIEKVLQKFIQSEYYDQYDPNRYIRTMSLLEKAPIIITPKFVGNQIICGVELDPSQLAGDTLEHNKQILNWAVAGYHGSDDIYRDGKFIEASINSLFQSQEHMKVLAEELRLAGLDVRF